MRVDAVATNAVGGTDDVRIGGVGQEFSHLVTDPLVMQRDLPTHGTAFPDAHEPDRVNPGEGHGVPLRVGNVGEGDRMAADGQPASLSHGNVLSS